MINVFMFQLFQLCLRCLSRHPYVCEITMNLFHKIASEYSICSIVHKWLYLLRNHIFSEILLIVNQTFFSFKNSRYILLFPKNPLDKRHLWFALSRNRVERDNVVHWKTNRKIIDDLQSRTCVHLNCHIRVARHASSNVTNKLQIRMVSTLLLIV